ncbi:MAG TPA: secretin N-terminal domain-containing protein [Thermoanaerobaculia bacterium]|jgi:hypothetical protein|nr:secretin N-terminal domain-containing protein [Thermoanaerobaculia bacterium]
MKRIAIVLMALLFVSAALADTADVGKSLSVRTFQFKHKQADKAAAIIKALMSRDGSMSIQPSANSLIVTDDPESLKKVAAALAAYDAPPQPFHLTVRLISAGRGGAKTEGARIPDELRDIESKLAVLRYDSIESLGVAEFDGKEGEPGLLSLTSYRAEFNFGEYDPASDTIAVTDFTLSRLTDGTLAPMMKTTLNLKLGQKIIVGVTRQPNSQRALMMVLSAKR